MDAAQRLAAAVRTRRTELGMSQSDVVHQAKRTGHELSIQTMSAIERGQRTSLRHVTASALEAALDWPTGAIDDALEGITPSSGRDEVSQLRDEVRELREAVGYVDPRSSDVRTIAGVLRALSVEQRRTFAEALALVEAEV